MISFCERLTRQRSSVILLFPESFFSRDPIAFFRRLSSLVGLPWMRFGR